MGRQAIERAAAGEKPATRQIRHYTPEEDELIFETFWNIAERQGLARRLNRPLRGINYRFYHILKSKGMTPEEYVALKGTSKIAEDGTPMLPLRRRGRPRKHWRWDDAADIRLWRMHKGGRGIEEIAAELGCPSVELCSQRLSYLEARNAAEAAAVELATKPASDASDAEVVEAFLPAASNDGLMETVKTLAGRLAKCEERVAAVEEELRTRPSINLNPEDVVAGLAYLASAASQRDEMLSALRTAESDKAALKAELEVERGRLERERSELKAVYADLEGVLHTFMNLSSIDKLRVLGDFSTRLEATVDRFGNVVNTKMILG